MASDTEQANSFSATSNADNNSDTRRCNVENATTTIDTITTVSSAVVDEWITEIRSLYSNISGVVVGLDTEWKFDVENNKRYPRLALLQLCVDTKCLIFQLCLKDFMPSSLGDFLLDPKFTFVGVEIDGDLKMLRNECELKCANSVDLWMVAKKKWPGRWRQKPGLKNLAREVAGIEIDKDKEISTGNWGIKGLSLKQIKYACLDAYASYKLGVALQSDF